MQRCIPDKPIKEPKPYSGTFPTLPTTLERKAVELAYPLGTAIAKAKYSGGSPKPAYKSALNKAYPNRSSWGAKSKAGASCDVFAGTCVRVVGISSAFPRGLEQQLPYLKKHFTKVSDIQGGDIRVRSNHIGIMVSIKGSIYTANAHHNSNGGTYPIIQKGIKFTTTYRPKASRTYLKLGDTFTGVKELQNFLKWAGYDCGTVDCEFGGKTETAVKNFQYHNGLTVDGIFGAKSLEKAKAVKK